MIFGTVDKELSKDICAQLMCIRSRLNHPSPSATAVKEIDIYINSPGGSVTDGMAIYDLIQMMKSEGWTIKTTCVGLAASMGSILLLSGSDGHRSITEFGEVLLHQPLIGGVIEGQATDLQISCEHMCRTRAKLYKIIQKVTGESMEKIEKDCNRDYWLDAAQAKAYGPNGIVNTIK